jgi:hypothetical protein
VFCTAEERLNRAIDDIKAVEEEKRRIAIESEQKKIEELQELIENLRQVRIVTKFWGKDLNHL